MRSLLSLVAARSGQLLVESSFGDDTRLPTVRRYLHLLEEVFLLERIPAWSRSLSSRAVGTPKVALVDSGVAAHLLVADSAWLARPDAPFGSLLEGFVLMELLRRRRGSTRWSTFGITALATELQSTPSCRTAAAKLIALEAEAGATVRSDDFRRLRHLAARLGNDFRLQKASSIVASIALPSPVLRPISASRCW